MPPKLTKAEFYVLLERFCIEHGFEIAGVGDATYGGILACRIGDDDPNRWDDWDENKFNWEDD